MGGNKSGKVKRFLRSFKAVRTWQLVLILIPMIFLAATLLRFDHLKMTELRDVVMSADAVGDNQGIEKSLENLQDFVFTHIVVNVVEENGVQSVVFGTGPFYLEQSYQRAANTAIEEAENTLANDSNPNGNIYEAVRQICQPLAQANGWSWSSQGYLDCWTSELAKYPTADTLESNLVAAKLPSTELYRRNYASPIWAPTISGFVILACVVMAIVIVVRGIIWLVARIAVEVLDRKSKANEQK